MENPYSVFPFPRLFLSETSVASTSTEAKRKKHVPYLVSFPIVFHQFLLLDGPSDVMTAGGPSAQQTAWEMALFSAPPVSVFPSRRELRFLAGRPATGGSTTKLAIFAAVRPDATILTHSFASSSKTHLPKCFVSRPPAELGLLSLLFVISMAMGAFLSVAVISLPTMSAFKKLAVSMEKMSKVASEEVPGTLSSLKLSGLEINDLTQQLSSLRQRLAGKKGRNQKAVSRANEDSIMN